jgi:titin
MLGDLKSINDDDTTTVLMEEDDVTTLLEEDEVAYSRESTEDAPLAVRPPAAAQKKNKSMLKLTVPLAAIAVAAAVAIGVFAFNAGSPNPADVKGLSGKAAGLSDVELEWKGSDKAVGYEITISANKDAFDKAGKPVPSQPIVTNDTKINISGLVCDESYTLAVISFSEKEGVKYYQKGDAAKVDVDIPPPDTAVAGLEAVARSFDSVIMTWSAIDIPGATAAYSVCSAPSQDGEYLELYAGQETSFVAAGLAPESENFFKILSTLLLDGKEFAGESAPVSALTPALTLPAAKAKAEADGYSEMSVSWDTAGFPGVKISYIVQRSTKKDGKYKDVHKGDKTSYHDSGLDANTKYWYKVISVCNAGGREYRSESEAVSATTGSVPVQNTTPVRRSYRPPTSSGPSGSDSYS